MKKRRLNLELNLENTLQQNSDKAEKSVKLGSSER